MLSRLQREILELRVSIRAAELLASIRATLGTQLTALLAGSVRRSNDHKNYPEDKQYTAIPAAPAPSPPDPSSTMTLLSGDLRRVPVKKIVKKGSIHTFEDVSVPIAEALTEKEFVQIKKIHSYEDKPYKEDKKEEKLTLTLTFKPKMQPLETESDHKEEPKRGYSSRRSTCVIS